MLLLVLLGFARTTVAARRLAVRPPARPPTRLSSPPGPPVSTHSACVASMCISLAGEVVEGLRQAGHRVSERRGRGGHGVPAPLHACVACRPCAWRATTP